ncbi:hypothetical protein JZ751_005856, partial [Albula glossodonta]
REGSVLSHGRTPVCSGKEPALRSPWRRHKADSPGPADGVESPVFTFRSSPATTATAAGFHLEKPPRHPETRDSRERGISKWETTDRLRFFYFHFFFLFSVGHTWSDLDGWMRSHTQSVLCVTRGTQPLSVLFVAATGVKAVHFVWRVIHPAAHTLCFGPSTPTPPPPPLHFPPPPHPPASTSL